MQVAGGCYDTAEAHPSSMIESLFQIGPYRQSPFGLMVVAAFLAGFFQLRANMRRQGLGQEEDPHILVFWAMLGGILGGKVYFAVLNLDWRLLYSRSGLVWYGGFLAAAAAVLWVAHRRRLPLGSTLDAAAPALALGYGVGRVGCFLVGDDYGAPTQLPWGVKFPVGLPPTYAHSLRREFGIEVPVLTCPAHRQRMIRISAYLYNTVNDYEKLAEALSSVF